MNTTPQDNSIDDSVMPTAGVSSARLISLKVRAKVRAMAGAMAWVRRFFFNERCLAYGVLIVVLALGVASFIVLSSEGFLSGENTLASALLIVNSVALGVLVILVARQVYRLFAERRARLAGYQLHLRLVALFGVITVVPTMIIVAFSFFILDFSLRGWFSDRVETAITSSTAVANSYLEEHIRSVEGQILAMANDINREAPRLLSDRQRFDAFLSNQVGVRNLSEALVIDSTGRIIATSRFAYAVTFSSLDDAFFDTTRDGAVSITTEDTTNRIRAGVRLSQFIDAYLLVGRFIDPEVSQAVDQTRLAALEYSSINIRQLNLKVSFAVLFGMVALLLLLGAIWLGLTLATAIVEPLSAVIFVAEKVRSGHTDERVVVNSSQDEVAKLGLSFNRMLDDIDKNREKLVEANRQLDKRRDFTEAVLSGVASGVIGLDAARIITLPNLAALDMLGLRKIDTIGKRLDALVPEFAALLDNASRAASRRVGTRHNQEQNIEIKRGDNTINLLAKTTVERIDNQIVGFVVTFENVSDLLDAQRKAAWADVARRIAHEIKNPLTPIQLATERLKAKYAPSDAKHKNHFIGYIETINRQVDDIGRMVNEFSSFARMPAPDMHLHNLIDMAQGQITLFEAATSGVDFTFDSKGVDTLIALCDDGMMRQAITNLLQNAVDAMVESGSDDCRIRVDIETVFDEVSITVTDNGPGLPITQGVDLTQPYITMRKNGTGLGLAIVRKIAEDHNGRLILGASGWGGRTSGTAADGHYKGAVVSIILPLPQSVKGA